MTKDKVRLYQLARELNVDSKRLIELLKSAGVEIKNHMTAIDSPTRELAVDLLSGKKSPASVRGQKSLETESKPSQQASSTPESIPAPKAKRLVSIPVSSGSTVEEEAEPVPVEGATGELQPAALDRVESIPADEMDQEDREDSGIPSEDLPLIPQPTPTKLGAILPAGGESSVSGQMARTAKERKKSPSTVHIASPPSSPKPPRPPKKEKEVAQQPVLRHRQAEALRKEEVVSPDPSIEEIAEQESQARSKKKAVSLTGRQKRQQLRGQRALQRNQLQENLEDEDQSPRQRIRRRTRTNVSRNIVREGAVVLVPPITVRSFSEVAGIRANQVLKTLMSLGMMNTINSSLSKEEAENVALELGIDVKFKKIRDAESRLEDVLAQVEEDTENLIPRTPVVTFMGHVDHGKTSLMDRIRQTNVTGGESGGITQQIGAYRAQTHAGAGAVTFLDTPGHEAFTAMRARGANVTDLVVLVVAAEDGVMPQTEEAINHAKAAEVPIVVAVNKIDLPGANIQRVQEQLSNLGLNPEAWGGDTQMIGTSATTGEGVDALLEALSLEAELRELKANSKRPAIGNCIEASISEDRGVQATLLVRDGTLRLGDVIVCGTTFGRVRAMSDDRSRTLQEAGPSIPVLIMGLNEVPEAGEKFHVIEDLAQARGIADERKTRRKIEAQSGQGNRKLVDLHLRLQEEKLSELALIVKVDVRGTLEAIGKEIQKLQHAEVRVSIKHQGVGTVNESDVLLADASGAIIIGFNVVADDRAQSMATKKGIEIRQYNVIYQVTDDIRRAMEGLLEPGIEEVGLGRAVIQQIFNISRVGTIAGCRVVQGTVERGARARIIRDGSIIGEYPIETLRRVKDDAKEVREGMECGIKLAGFNDVKHGDVFAVYKTKEIKRSLEE